MTSLQKIILSFPIYYIFPSYLMWKHDSTLLIIDTPFLITPDFHLNVAQKLFFTGDLNIRPREVFYHGICHFCKIL